MKISHLSEPKLLLSSNQHDFHLITVEFLPNSLLEFLHLLYAEVLLSHKQEPLYILPIKQELNSFLRKWAPEKIEPLPKF